MSPMYLAVIKTCILFLGIELLVVGCINSHPNPAPDEIEACINGALYAKGEATIMLENEFQSAISDCIEMYK